MNQPRKATVKILTEGLGFLPPSVTGYGRPIQGVEMQISETGSKPQDLLSVNVSFPESSLWLCERLASRLSARFPRLCFELQNGEGEADVHVPADQLLDPFLVAAAVAVLKASWGWDESNPFRITVAGQLVLVHVEFTEGCWWASEPRP